VISDIRREYASRSLSEADTDPDPITQFRVWFDEALRSEVFDVNAMGLATASTAGEPSARIVLLKGVDEQGFVFFTHYDSAKGRDLARNPRAALLFYWAELERQVRIVGAVERVPREASEAYFATRPVESQWAAWSARQSDELATRDDLERQFSETKQRFANQPVPCPPDWGGFRVAPERIEFWQGRPSRLHDRLLYTKQHDGSWSRVRLAP
jgi:pyridoxamine 5'-phosphate oxidase